MKPKSTKKTKQSLLNFSKATTKGKKMNSNASSAASTSLSTSGTVESKSAASSAPSTSSSTSGAASSVASTSGAVSVSSQNSSQSGINLGGDDEHDNSQSTTLPDPSQIASRAAPELHSIDEQIERARQKLLIRHRKQDPNITTKEAEKLGYVGIAVNALLWYFEASGIDVRSWWQLRKVTGTAGLYAMYKTLQDLLENHFKIGSSSTDRKKRVGDQKHVMAFTLMNLKELKPLIPQWVVDRLIELDLPYFRHHPCRREKVEDEIAIQLAEIVAVVAFKGCTENRIGEKLLKLPGPWARELSTASQLEVPPELVEFLTDADGIPLKGELLGTWITLASHLHELAREDPDDAFLKHNLKPLPKGQFVTNFLMEILLGRQYRGFRNATKVPPVVTKNLNPFLDAISSLLEDPEKNSELIKAKFEQEIKGLGCYIYPTDEERAADAKTELLSMLETIDARTQNIYVERISVQMLQKHNGDWWNKTFEHLPHLTFQNMEFYQTRDAPHVRLTQLPSIFRMLGEEVQNEERIDHAMTFYAMANMLKSAGYHEPGSDELKRLEDYAEKIETFVMRLEGIGDKCDGSHITARAIISGENWFQPNHPNVEGLSHLTKAHAENLKYLGYKLGQEGRMTLAKALQLPKDIPWEPTFKCPGVPAVGRFKAEKCCSDPNDPKNIICLVGALCNHTFGKESFVCRRCHGKLRPREREYHKNLDAGSPEAALHADRGKTLKRQSERHAENERVKRRKRVEENGLEKTQEDERAKSRRHLQKKAAERFDNPKTTKKAAPGTIVTGKASIYSNRATDPDYPPAIRRKLLMACLLFCVVNGWSSGSTFTTTQLNKVMHGVLRREMGVLKGMGIKLEERENGDVKGCSKKEYQEIAMSTVGTKGPSGNTWKINEDFEERKATLPRIELMTGKPLSTQVDRIIQVIYQQASGAEARA